jgi:hypothetical protein
MEEIKYFENALVRAHQYCRKHDFTGYSLYDSHNSIIPFGKFGPFVSFYVNQVIKRSPFNFRPLLGIKKGINPKGVGLFLNIYTKMKHTNLLPGEEVEKLARCFFYWLINNPSKGFSGLCWGYNYDWPSRDGSLVKAYTPSGVVTGFNCRAMMTYYNIYGDPEVKQAIKSAADFVLNDLILSETKYGLCFSYTPNPKDLTVNASLLAAEVLAYDDYLHETENHTSKIAGVLEFTRNLQNTDGSWHYSFNPETFAPKVQIDFHQGYVLETIDNILNHVGLDRRTYEESIQKGIKFYQTHQIDPEGLAYWRLPSKWPIDIHNQSQAIITLARFSNLDKTYLAIAKKVASWTIENMLSSDGKFYYQKWPILINRVSYMRWNQAWMMLAIVELLNCLYENN